MGEMGEEGGRENWDWYVSCFKFFFFRRLFEENKGDKKKPINLGIEAL